MNKSSAKIIALSGNMYKNDCKYVQNCLHLLNLAGILDYNIAGHRSIKTQMLVYMSSVINL